MSYYLKKLFPRNASSFSQQGLKLVIISEGYLASQRTQFYTDVMKLWYKLDNYYPISRGTNGKIGFYAIFVGSSNSGFANSFSNAVGYNVFETYYDSNSNNLKLNISLYNQLIEDSILREGGVDYYLADLIRKSDYPRPFNDFIPIVLLPTSNNINAEFEQVSSQDYYSAGTSFDGNCEQLIVRVIGKIIGLGDEYELSGQPYSSPNANEGTLAHLKPNLIYIENLGLGISPNTPGFKWSSLFPYSSTLNISAHAHPGNATTADRNIPGVEFNYNKIALWEGGDGFRSKIYRSSFDCIMRRRIGDSSLPIKQKRINFCPVCMKIFERYL